MPGSGLGLPPCTVFCIGLIAAHYDVRFRRRSPPLSVMTELGSSLTFGTLAFGA